MKNVTRNIVLDASGLDANAESLKRSRNGKMMANSQLSGTLSLSLSLRAQALNCNYAES